MGTTVIFRCKHYKPTKVLDVSSIRVKVNDVFINLNFKNGGISATCRNRFLEFDDGLDPHKGNIK